jgi:hypothetical protein
VSVSWYCDILWPCHATTLPASVIIAGNTTSPSVTSDPCIDTVTVPEWCPSFLARDICSKRTHLCVTAKLEKHVTNFVGIDRPVCVYKLSLEDSSIIVAQDCWHLNTCVNAKLQFLGFRLITFDLRDQSL